MHFSAPTQDEADLPAIIGSEQEIDQRGRVHDAGLIHASIIRMAT